MPALDSNQRWVLKASAKSKASAQSQASAKSASAPFERLSMLAVLSDPSHELYSLATFCDMRYLVCQRVPGLGDLDVQDWIKDRSRD